MSIISFTVVIGAPVGKLSASFSLAFSLNTGMIKKVLQITRNKKKKKTHKILVLARSKLNSIETLISKALIDYKISYEEYETVIMKKKNTKKMKEDIRMIKSEKIDT